ncbi:WYL domain-containing protein [Streptomyces laculatispora]|uniref:WYL domain-containing protein n=1 Tax=Streptomyces laculatispora TaxID=887464 RepID=A0ABY9IA78_9ACTN|nr:WYL domain-containing protein [Streptomyces laculatispora]WLQ43331.1 WYL domain-containing protein [Streptomyces laculatispora]
MSHTAGVAGCVEVEPLLDPAGVRFLPAVADAVWNGRALRLRYRRRFDLVGYWQARQTEFHAWLHTADAVVRVSPEGAARLTGAAARALHATGEVQPDGWTRAALPVESMDRACREFLALGAGIEVLEPAELRARMAATARAIAALNGG